MPGDSQSRVTHPAGVLLKVTLPRCAKLLKRLSWYRLASTPKRSRCFPFVMDRSSAS